ncbi:Papain fold toxin 1, glutamine deamidase [Chryseobacterium oleae]|uniref:Papain fold toxin 1, glutamine deamidase n=1 Tax=Chryseobacterium oleae TaxID=491207 RepID=A0A1I5A464_CHROL|nr:toxin glutamine deamidase domain-containing protein [Chryseobacterium oleae]SFN57315.1 Papain fold toxin 1, glutamine deamidase [Chryseobacterium oleae]
MEKLDDESGDLSGFKILSFEEVNKGFKGNKNPLQGLSGIQNSEGIETKDDEYINLTQLLGDIKSSYSGGKGEHMPYVFNEYFQDIAQTYIMDGEKHIGVSAKIYLKNGVVKVSQNMGLDKPRMEVFFDEDDKLTYALTFRYDDTMQDAIDLKTHSFVEYKNLLLYLGYGNVETDYDASTFFIKEFTRFLEGSGRADDLYKVYGDLPTSFIIKIHLPTEVVVNHLKILTKEDNSGWFSWTKDTTSLLIKVMGMFRKFQEATDYFWKNPKLLTEIYDNLDGHSEVLGQFKSNRILFASVLNVFAQRDVNSKSKITKNVLLNGNGYFIESNILELNDTVNTIKGIMSFDWDFDYKDTIFLQQKRKVKQQVKIVSKEGDPLAEETVTQDIDPGYFYHPMNLVHFTDKSQEKANLVTALFIKAIADEQEWAEVMQNIRIGGDIVAIIAGFMTMGLTGNLSVLAIADIGLASIDLALMNEDVKKWIADLPGGKWFVENWDTIYALVGAGILSAVMIEGILTHGPALLEKIKSIKNLNGNYLIFTQQLEKLITELEAYRLRNPGNVLEEVVLVGEKNGLLKKLLKPFLGADANLEYIIEQLGKRNISVKKAGDNFYKVYYKDDLVILASEKETGVFLRNNFYKTETQLEEIVFGGTSKKLFSIWKINLKEGRYNCVNCTIATDATLAGRPTSALPYTIQTRFRNGKWENYTSFNKGTKLNVLETEFGSKFSDWTTDLDILLQDLKPGKRGIIAGIKKGKNEGHVFNVVNEKGVIKYLDGQTGKRTKLIYDYYQFLPTN